MRKRSAAARSIAKSESKFTNTEPQETAEGVFLYGLDTIGINTILPLEDPTEQKRILAQWFSWDNFARTLSHIARFNGQTPYHYSVAQHSVTCAFYGAAAAEPLANRRWLLLHDAAEAIIGDIIRPFKNGYKRDALGGAEFCTKLLQLEEVAEEVIITEFSCNKFEGWKDYDNLVNRLEVQHFYKGATNKHFEACSPEYIESVFLDCAQILTL